MILDLSASALSSVLRRLCSAVGLLVLGLLGSAIAEGVEAQAVKGSPPADADPPALTYRGLVPGVDDGRRVREVLGEPVFESEWYSYKLYYPAAGREGHFDVVHLHGPEPDSGLANVDAASVPEGLDTEERILQRFGEPEYRLVMSRWRLLDYSEAGLRFAVGEDGGTIGVAYFPHGYRRVPPGERRLVDLSTLRQGPQPAPVHEPTYEGLRAGASEIVISPTEAAWLPRPFEIHDHLKARTVVLERGELSYALVGADLFGMGHPEIRVMRDRVREAGVDHLVLAMSHNHAAPDTIGVYGHYPAEYIGYLQDRVVEGVRRALASLRPVSGLRSASRELPMDGMRVEDLFRNARNPGLLDPTVSALQILVEAPEDRDQEVLATLVHFACHVESLADGARRIGADFPGVMADELQRRGAGQVVFLNGAVGGMVSGDNRERTFASSREMGLALADVVEDLLKVARPPERLDFSVDVREIEIPMVNPEFRPLYEAGLRELAQGRVATDMLYLRLGEAQIVTLPGELLPEVSFEILERMDGFPRMLVGLANDQLGYMIPPYDFREGFYEESMSQGPSTALVVRDAAIRMLEGIP